jgi:D-alanine transaminase
MSELIWMNGQVMPLAEARVGVEDRGFQFADGAYEVIRIYNGRCFALPEHLERLQRSCGGLEIAMPMPAGDLAAEVESLLLRRGGLKDGMVYMQVTRGCAPREHAFPDCPPTLLFYTRALPPLPGHAPAAKLWPVADERWKRCWVKSIALLANVLARNAAVTAGADEAIFVEDGLASECSSSNFFAVAGGTLLTAPIGPRVLPGITRMVLLDIARRMKLPAVERPVSEAEALAADELFITSTIREISWVSHWHGRPLRRHACGPVTMQLHLALRERIKQETLG